MNACEDETEPLGELPDVPARSGVSVVLAAAEREAAYARACGEIRALHLRVGVRVSPDAPVSGVRCGACDVPWPCATAEILDRLGV